MSEKIRKLMVEFQKKWYIPLMILAGIVMMLQPFLQSDTTAVSVFNSDDAFVEETENRVEEMLKSVAGAGECVVTITLSSGSKKEYVREGGNVLVITDNQGNESAVVSKENMPEIAGVTVASKGAEQLTVRNNIIHSVSTLLGIGTNKICVIMSE